MEDQKKSVDEESTELCMEENTEQDVEDTDSRHDLAETLVITMKEYFPFEEKDGGYLFSLIELQNLKFSTWVPVEDMLPLAEAAVDILEELRAIN